MTYIITTLLSTLTSVPLRIRAYIAVALLMIATYVIAKALGRKLLLTVTSIAVFILTMSGFRILTAENCTAQYEQEKTAIREYCEQIIHALHEKKGENKSE